MSKPADPPLPDFLEETLAEQGSIDANERALLREIFGSELPLALAPLEASPSGRDRLLAAISKAPERYLPFLDRLTALFDLGAERVREILSAIDDPSAWEPGPMPCLEVMHFAGGPRLASADTGLVRVAPHTVFPKHRHHADELVFILQGSYRDDSGKLWRAGDLHEMPPDSAHAYQVTEEGLLFALVLHGDVEVEGVGLLPRGRG